MTAIWHNDGSGWRTLSAVGFADEATLHSLIEEAPQLLPLAGSSQLAVLGREVPLGGGYADLIAVESNGRLVVIEIKLSRNTEARRAVVAQVLTYAAFLQGTTLHQLETIVLGKELSRRNLGTVADALEASLGIPTAGDAFGGQVEASLASGQFRLVIVLDSAPPELVKLVGYLSNMTDRLVIDLVTVAAYEAGGVRFMVPQRVEPERLQETVPTHTFQQPTTDYGALTEGVEPFVDGMAQRPVTEQAQIRALVDWAEGLRSRGWITLHSYRGKTMTTLLPRLQPENVGLVTIAPAAKPVWLFQSVFLRRAPVALRRVEEIVGPIGQGTAAAYSDALRDALTQAYAEAVGATSVEQRAT